MPPIPDGGYRFSYVSGSETLVAGLRSNDEGTFVIVIPEREIGDARTEWDVQTAADGNSHVVARSAECNCWEIEEVENGCTIDDTELSGPWSVGNAIVPDGDRPVVLGSPLLPVVWIFTPIDASKSSNVKAAPEPIERRTQDKIPSSMRIRTSSLRTRSEM